MVSMNAAVERAGAQVAHQAGARTVIPMKTVAVRYVVLNQKGGVGKTQTTFQVGRELAELGLRVLVVDFDPQGNLTYAMGLLPPEDTPEDAPSLPKAMTGAWTGTPRELVVEYPHAPGLLLLPWSWDHFSMAKDLEHCKKQEERLSWVLDEFDGFVDVILVDCPPSLDVLNDNALMAIGDGRGKVLVPVEAEDFSLRATNILLGQIKAAEIAFRMTIDILGFVVSKMTDTLLALDCLEKILAIPGIPVLATVKHRTEIQQCVREHKALRDHAPKNDQLAVYTALAGKLKP